MKIVICVKHVPETNSVQVDPETGTLIREGVSSILNPFCEYALDEAVRIGKKSGGAEIVAVTMGPPQARSALLRCLELGANSGVLLSDRSFAGSDCWATALALTIFIRREIGDFDLILTGKQAIDGDTAQVPAEMAEMLGIPQITGCSGVEIDGGSVLAIRELESGTELIRAKIPALISIGKGSNIRRLPSMADFLESRSREIRIIGADDLEMDVSRLGLLGSLTQVTRVFPPPVRERGKIVDGSDPEKAAERLLMFLDDLQIKITRGEDSC